MSEAAALKSDETADKSRFSNASGVPAQVDVLAYMLNV